MIIKKYLKEIFYFLCFPLLLYFILPLKHKHLGEEVYILADSTELRFMDLSIFDDKPMICFNESFFIKEILNRREVTYAHTIESFYFFKGYKTNNRKKIYLQNLIKPLIKTGKIIFFTNITNFLNFLPFNVKYVFMRFPFDKFTNKFRNEFIVTRWSMKFAISLAIYMGFKKAYLIGFSFHSDSYRNHWYDNITISKFDASKKLQNNYEFNFFFTEAQKEIELVGITVNEPNNSYLNYMLYNEFSKQKLYLRDPYSMTDFKDLILFNELERKKIQGF
jgi:hypothetical protein